MSEPFVGEIKMFAGNFAPRNWALCDGQLLAISQNSALFSLLGTIYGGDGRTTFGLPDMRGRIPIHPGTGPDLTNRPLGSKSGSENVTLTINQIPAHNHSSASTNAANKSNPADNKLADSGSKQIYTDQAGSPPATLSSLTSPSIGGSQRHSNIMPYLCIHYIIALFGIYPSRN